MINKIINMQSDLKSIETAFSPTVEDIGIFGSFLNPNLEPHDIDVVIEVENKALLLDVEALDKLKLSLPIAQVDIDGYRKNPTCPTIGYHLLILSTSESKRYFSHVNQNAVLFKSNGTLNKWLNRLRYQLPKQFKVLKTTEFVAVN